LTATQRVSPELRDWVVAQLAAGQPAAVLLRAMLDSGWSRDVALSVLGAEVEEVAGRGAWPGGGADRRRAPGLTPGALERGRVTVADHDVDILVHCDCPQLVVLGGFLTPAECTGLIEEARARLKPSETVVGDTGGSEVNVARTSEGMFFGRGESELCQRIEARIAALLSWPVSHGEGLQVLRYGPGAQYRPHHDYFDPDLPGSSRILQRGGQRVATLVMYLNTPEEGGATTFPEAGLTVHAVAGHAVFFSYDRPDPATRTLHGGAPVIAGEKWVATKWLREGTFA
jgi:prolyl 4-hydroxylase